MNKIFDVLNPNKNIETQRRLPTVPASDSITSVPELVVFDTDEVPTQFASHVPENEKMYFATQGSMNGFEMRFVSVLRHGVTVLTLPYFKTKFSLDTMVSEGWLRNILKQISFNVSICGSPITCFLQTEGDVNEAHLNLISEHLIRKNSLVAFKGLQTNCQLKSFTKAASLPVAHLRIVPNHLESLKKNRNLNRKLKASKDIQFFELTHPDTQQLDKIYELYSETHSRSKIQFGKLERSYFEKSVGGCTYLIATHNGKWVGFAQLWIKGDKMVASFLGMDYELDSSHGLYFAIYFQIIKFAEENRISTVNFGETTYEFKKRIGCDLEECYVYYRHKSAIVNTLLNVFKFIVEPGKDELK